MGQMHALKSPELTEGHRDRRFLGVDVILNKFGAVDLAIVCDIQLHRDGIAGFETRRGKLELVVFEVTEAQTMAKSVSRRLIEIEIGAAFGDVVFTHGPKLIIVAIEIKR